MRERTVGRKREREAWQKRLRNGTATYEDLLRAVHEGCFKTREDAKRAWGLL